MQLIPVLQRAWIDSVEVRVYASAIETVLDGASQIQFAMDADANPGIIPLEGQDVEVEQISGPVERTFKGRINWVRLERGAGYTRWVVNSLGDAAVAGHIRFEAIIGPGQAGELIDQVWSEHGPEWVTTDIMPGAPLVDQYISNFGTLADFNTYLTQTTGWAWSLENGTLRFFDPSQGDDGTVVQSDLVAGSLRIRRGLQGVFNIARQQAYTYRTITFSRPLSQCSNIVALQWNQSAPDGVGWGAWEFASGQVRWAHPVDPNLHFSDIEVQGFAGDAGTVQLSHQVDGTKPLQVRVTLRRLVWVEAENEESIALYGRREAPTLDHDGSMGINEALRRLSSYLHIHAHPAVEVRASLNRMDIDAGHRVHFDLPQFGLDRHLIVENVVRTFGTAGLTVTVSARSGVTEEGLEGERAAAQEPEPMPEVYRRLEKLEARNLSPLGLSGSIFHKTGPITAVPTFAGDWAWAGEFETAEIPHVDMEAGWAWDGEFEAVSVLLADVEADWVWAGEFDVTEIEPPEVAPVPLGDEVVALVGPPVLGDELVIEPA